MNLVAKEFVAAQDAENPGALILSHFAGAAPEMSEALLINPYDSDDIADALNTALTMPLDERRRRWETLDEEVTTRTAAHWAHGFLVKLQESNDTP